MSQGSGRSTFNLRVTVKRRADERLTFLSCSLDPALQYTQTFIIDWIKKGFLMSQGSGRSTFNLRVTVKRRADERLTFLSCSLDPALQYTQTFIIDWINAPSRTGN
ncbi:hypothetical protein SprV_0902798700 [Sparganum proliferum]